MKDQFVIPENECLTCHYVMDGATNPFNDRRPGKGGLAICVKCGTLSQFDERLNMVPLTEDELEKIRRTSPVTWEQLRTIQAEIDRLNKKN